MIEVFSLRGLFIFEVGGENHYTAADCMLNKASGGRGLS